MKERVASSILESDIKDDRRRGCSGGRGESDRPSLDCRWGIRERIVAALAGVAEVLAFLTAVVEVVAALAGGLGSMSAMLAWADVASHGNSRMSRATAGGVKYKAGAFVRAGWSVVTETCGHCQTRPPPSAAGPRPPTTLRTWRRGSALVVLAVLRSGSLLLWRAKHRQVHFSFPECPPFRRDERTTLQLGVTQAVHVESQVSQPRYASATMRPLCG